jgi:hypothetical protein
MADRIHIDLNREQCALLLFWVYNSLIGRVRSLHNNGDIDLDDANKDHILADAIIQAPGVAESAPKLSKKIKTMIELLVQGIREHGQKGG